MHLGVGAHVNRQDTHEEREEKVSHVQNSNKSESPVKYIKHQTDESPPPVSLMDKSQSLEVKFRKYLREYSALFGLAIRMHRTGSPGRLRASR